MSKSFVYDRWDVSQTLKVGGQWDSVRNAEGKYVLAEDAINRETLLQTQIKTLETQLKGAREDATCWRNLLDSAGEADDSCVYIVGTMRFYAGALSTPKPRASYKSSVGLIRQAVFRWVDKGDAPTLADGLRLNKEDASCLKSPY